LEAKKEKILPGSLPNCSTKATYKVVLGDISLLKSYIRRKGEDMKQILSNSRLSLLLLMFVCILCTGLSVVKADFVTSGNTFLDNYGELDATDNWVVFETSGLIGKQIVDSFVKGTDSPDFDVDSSLTFIYQLANNGGGNEDVDKLRQCVVSSTCISSWGYFSNWGLTDAGNPVGITENMGEDTWPDGGGNMRYGGEPNFVYDSDAYVDPYSTTIIEDVGLDWIEWFFNPVLRPELDVSSLLVYTSPMSEWSSIDELIHEPDCTWVGGFDNPHPVPEPATMTLLGIGALALLRKRRSV
jgi:hypothetical protein